MRVDWTPTATDDLERLWLFMAERNIDHADRIERRINEAAAKLGRFHNSAARHRSRKSAISRWLISNIYYDFGSMMIASRSFASFIRGRTG